MWEKVLAVLVIQYPDSSKCGFKTLTATRDRQVMPAFREAVLAEVQHKVMQCIADSVLSIEYETDLERMKQILDLPITNEAKDGG